MKYLILSIFTLQMFSSQGQSLDEKSFRKLNNQILKTCFDNLDTIPYIDTSKLWTGPFCNLLSMAYLDVNIKDTLFVNAMMLRLEQIAVKHYESGRPIYLVSPGMNSFSRALQLNNEDKKKKITYLSFGNTCLTTEYFLRGVDHINQKTLELMNKTQHNKK